MRGPLHGIPVLVKDNLDAFGMPTTAGSVALERSYPREDSTVVAKLRAAGAVLLGKTNLTEFANFLAANMPAGYSSLGGQVLNAYDTDASPGGSSSGSGTAAASGLATITIGTETSGSIISPASAQGIVGLRPTVGLVSRTGILPISATQDTAGPMTRTVADAAAELQAIAGRDPEDPATAGAPARVPDFIDALEEDALAGTRIGVITSNDASYNAAKAAIEAAGATPVQLTLSPPSVPSILTYEFKRDLNAYLDRLPSWAPMQSLQDILDFADAHPLEMKKFGYQRADEAQAVDLTDPATYATYVTERDQGQAAVRSFIDTTIDRGTADPSDDLAAIMTPANTLTGVGARAGYPQLTVPAGYTSTQRRPVNISFNGPAYSEQTLLALGHAYEQATKLQRPPSVINPALYALRRHEAAERLRRALVCARSRAAEAGGEGAEAAVLARAGLDRRPPAPDGEGHAELGDADEGVPGRGSRARTPPARRSTPSGSSTATRSTTRGRSIASGPVAACAARCTASPCW